MKKTFDRIDWKRGMEIMPETFLYADGYHDSVSRLNRQLLVPFAYGLVPFHDFTLKYTIFDHKFTIDKISCSIMDCEGNILNITKGTSLSLPKEAQGTFYLAVSCGEEEHVEKNGVPMVEQSYQFQIINLLNPCSPLLFPLLKLQVRNGEWEALDFIPPCCAISAHGELTNLTNQCRQWLDKIIALVENKEYSEAYYQIGYVQIELTNAIRYATPSMLISLLKKAVFILKTNQLLNKEDLSRAGEFVWLEYNPNTLSETIQTALSFLHSAVTFLQHAKPEPAPVVEKPKQEPEEEEIAYLL
jgi:hypothetical protein